MTTISKNDYNRKKNLITIKIKTLPETCQHLNKIIGQLSRLDIRDSGLKVNRL